MTAKTKTSSEQDGLLGNFQKVTQGNYLEFLETHTSVAIEGVDVKLLGPTVPKVFGPPEDYKLETTTVWSFSDRGKWATHRGNYRGNWSPYVPRNVILRYTNPGELILDQMCGSGTTLVEARLLGRPAVGVDINHDAIMVARDRLAFDSTALPAVCLPVESILTYVGDARSLSAIEDDSVALVCTHPPYANIVSYTRKEVGADLSGVGLPAYFEGMKVVAEESFRVVAPGRHCAILMGDTRKHKHYIPRATRVMEIFLEVGFLFKEDVIKQQWNMKATRERWRGMSYDFLKIAHEHLFVFRKPELTEKIRRLQYSSNWH